MTEHVLKTTHEAWLAVESGKKRFEVRKNDRLFQTGDTVVLRKLNGPGSLIDKTHQPEMRNGEYRELRFRVGWILQGGQFGVEPGYCVFQLEEPSA